jgi:hypothetical protein
MYAVFIEVNADESHLEAARRELPKTVVPMARQVGAKAGWWLAPQGGRGVAVMVFESEDEARKVASEMKPGEPAGAEVPGVTFKTVEVREVLASL